MSTSFFALFVVTSLVAVNALSIGGNSCLHGTPLVSCFVNPCQVTKCPAHPSAQCVPDYCGGCYARFFVGGQRVKCSIQEPLPVATTAPPAPTCSGAHEVYSLCSGGACQSTCAHQVNCLVCSPGCACEEGYIRETENGACGPKKLCPQQCGANEEYTGCGGACQPTCSNPYVTCRACIPGCSCKAGFIKSSTTGVCIPAAVCLDKQCQAKKPNSQYTQCGGICQPTCSSPFIVCKACFPGCSCRKGYIQSYPNGPCIRKYTCPPDTYPFLA